MLPTRSVCIYRCKAIMLPLLLCESAGIHCRINQGNSCGGNSGGVSSCEASTYTRARAEHSSVVRPSQNLRSSFDLRETFVRRSAASVIRGDKLHHQRLHGFRCRYQLIRHTKEAYAAKFARLSLHERRSVPWGLPRPSD